MQNFAKKPKIVNLFFQENKDQNTKKQKELERTKYVLSLLCHVYGFERVISIVETILDLVSPSRGGISAVPMAILVTVSSFRKRLRVISATSTAVVIA